MSIGLVFDCDGTLIHSEDLHFKSWQLALSSLGVQYEFTERDYPHFTGLAGLLIAQKLIDNWGLTVAAEQLFTAKRNAYNALQREGIPPIRRTLNLLKALYLKRESHNLSFALASGAHKEEILTNLAHQEITHLFDFIVSGHDDLAHYSDPEGVNKPKPYIYLHTAELLGLPPARCIAFEDSGPGVQSATAAGFVTIALPNRFTLDHDFRAAHRTVLPDEEIPLSEILEIII